MFQSMFMYRPWRYIGGIVKITSFFVASMKRATSGELKRTQSQALSILKCQILSKELQPLPDYLLVVPRGVRHRLPLLEESEGVGLHRGLGDEVHLLPESNLYVARRRLI